MPRKKRTGDGSAAEPVRTDQCHGHGAHGRCLLGATLDGKWCPWHWDLARPGRYQGVTIMELDRWLRRQEEEFNDYRWRMHSTSEWWDLLNGREVERKPQCEVCGRPLGPEPVIDRYAVACSAECWGKRYSTGEARGREEATA